MALTCKKRNAEISALTTLFEYNSIISSSPSSTEISTATSSPLSETTTNKVFLKVKNDDKMLSKSIMDVHENITQTERTLMKKLRLRDLLYYSIVSTFPVCGLYVVGSSLNGFGNETSDMDLCFVITNGELDQRTDAVNVLNAIYNILSTLPAIKEQTLILAKVPILRIKFRGPFSDMIVDLNCNNSVAVRNTHLLCYYAFFDWRVRPLVTIVKEWAKQNNINDSTRSTFTSYSLVLMVLHYLQVVDEPVLPSLQQHFPKRFNPRVDIRTLNLSHPLEVISPESNFKGSNTSSLGTLLIGFFDYYANQYNYETNAISIRLGREVKRGDVIRHITHWSPICIEEPFTLSNTAHSVYDEMIFKSIKQKFKDAHKILSTTMDLNNLMTIQPFTREQPINHQDEIEFIPYLSDSWQ
jgi:poly(A) RNA polymerase GLD2